MPPEAVRFNVVPAQIGPLFPAVAAGKAFTVALVVAMDVHPEALVTVTVYTPLIATVAFVLLGFCCVELKEPGPAQL